MHTIKLFIVLNKICMHCNEVKNCCKKKIVSVRSYYQTHIQAIHLSSNYIMYYITIFTGNFVQKEKKKSNTAIEPEP